MKTIEQRVQECREKLEKALCNAEKRVIEVTVVEYFTDAECEEFDVLIGRDDSNVLRRTTYRTIAVNRDDAISNVDEYQCASDEKRQRMSDDFICEAI